MSDASVPLEYKVIELSLVDERSLEQTVNHWVRQGWRLENVQFAMRESSRRPSMAFVFFTRALRPVAQPEPDDAGEVGAEADDRARAQARLERLASRGDTLTHATAPASGAPDAQDAWARLRALAEEEEERDAGAAPADRDLPPEEA
ncbi:MAG TPA: hypothetical protein VK013_08835 [Myxococcaceae bacterium]|nr:hypothetical protein [Myxococcaceae bacterium]